MTNELLEGMQRQIVRGVEFEVKTIYAVSGNTKTIEGKGVITARIDLYTKSLDASRTGKVQLHETTGCFPGGSIPTGKNDPIPNCDNRELRREVQEILDAKFPDYLVDAYLMANVNFSGRELFITGFVTGNEKYDQNKTLGPAFKEFARGLDLVVMNS